MTRPRRLTRGSVVALAFLAVLIPLVLVVVNSGDDDGGSTESDLAWAQAHGPIRIAAGPNAPPAYIADDDGNLVGGHLIELISLAAARAGVRIQYVPYADVGAAVQAVIDGDADLVIAAERPDIVAAGLEPTAPFGWPTLSIVSSSADINTHDDLAGRRVATVPGSPLEAILLDQLPDISYVETANIPEGFEMFLDGDVDAYFGSIDMVSYFLQEKFGLSHIVGDPLAIITASVYGPPSSPQLRLLAEGRDSLSRDEMRQAHIRWSGVDLTEPPGESGTGPVALALMAAMGAVLVVTIFLLRRRRAELERAQTVDPLTGLLNRAGIRGAADRTLANGTTAVCVVDLNGFKQVNDTLGHLAGDEVLDAVGRKMGVHLRTEQDALARVGGDEFIAVIDCSGALEPGAVVDRIATAWRTELAEPIPTRAGLAQVTASVGIAIGMGGEPFDELVEAADRMMYESKRAGDPVRQD